MATERKERLDEVYQHLRNHYGIHTQGEFSKALGYSRTAVSLALNGNKDYLTNKLFEKICEVYEGVFNLDYLLTGGGTLLLDTAYDRAAQPKPKPESELVAELRQRIADKEEHIATLRELMQTKDELIASLRQQLADAQQREVVALEKSGSKADGRFRSALPDIVAGDERRPAARK